MNLLTSKGWRGFLGGGKITRFVSWRKTDFPANRTFCHGGREGLENRAERTRGRLPEQSPGGRITVWYMSSVFRQPYPGSNMRGRMLLDLNSPLGQAGRWLGYSVALRTQDFMPWQCTWVQMVMVWPRWKDSQKDQGPVWETCLAVSSISVDPSTLLTGTNFLQAVHVPKEKKKQLWFPAFLALRELNKM